MKRRVDELDAEKRREQASQPINQQISPEKGFGSERPIANAPKRKGDEKHDDQGV
jgi:hypothetical protein